MTVKITTKIPLEKFTVFHEIMVASGCYYDRKPMLMHQSYHVSFVCPELNNYKDFNAAWERFTTPIREVRSDQLYKCLWRRLKGVFQ